MQRRLLTLVLVHQPHADRVLLGMKKRGFGMGRWNGFGGKVQEGESVAQAAQRELREEAGIEAEDLMPAGALEFTFAGSPDIHEVHVFRASRISGEPTESEEMRPQWFAVDDVPFDAMWPDDRHWFPLFLEGMPFRGAFAFDEDANITEMTLAEAPALAAAA